MVFIYKNKNGDLFLLKIKNFIQIIICLLKFEKIKLKFTSGSDGEKTFSVADILRGLTNNHPQKLLNLLALAFLAGLAGSDFPLSLLLLLLLLLLLFSILIGGFGLTFSCSGWGTCKFALLSQNNAIFEVHGTMAR